MGTTGISGHCAIVGIGQTPYTRGTEASTLELHLQAALAALDDAGLAVGDIDGVMPNELSGVIAEDLILNLGLDALRFTATIRTGGASFVTAIQNACLAIHAGVARHVLLVGGCRGDGTWHVARWRKRKSCWSAGAAATHSNASRAAAQGARSRRPS